MPNFNFPKNEEDILAFWQENKIFKKSLEKKSPKGDFVFYDGPPFATGLPHYGHIVASIMKDSVPRYKTMRGYHVPRHWGWDCHGLPVENIVEKELHLKGKEDIEALGVGKFNETCHSKVLMYADEWKKFIPRIGRFVNMEEDYRTMNPQFMESVWWVFKTLYDKSLIYEGYKSMHLCPRCETTLSNFEVTQNYKDIRDLSVTAKFKLKNPEKLGLVGDVFILAWTTTPWTLPGNVALAVGEDIEYVVVKKPSYYNDKKVVYEFIILAKDVFDNLKKLDLTDCNPTYNTMFQALEHMDGDQSPEVSTDIKTIHGNDLIGLEYEPLFDDFKNADLPNKENLYKVVSANFVTTEDGTGVVHIAPAFGEDDLNLGNEKKLSFIQHVDMTGHISADVKEFAGLSVKPPGGVQGTDKKIIEYLTAKGLVFSTEEYLHSYPHCWRCETPLINYSTSSWFVKVTDIRDNMIKNNEKIHWVPEHIKEGRFGKWLEGAKDWAISRNRYWGTPIPVWKCDKCNEVKVVGSIAELEKLSGKKVTNLHSQFMKDLELNCDCGAKFYWINEVLDCWFESGSMPYAQFATREKTKLPADFIAEGVDQTRGWFYTLLVLATGLFNKPPFKNVIVNGIVLASDGQKMSKSKKNYPDPNEVISKYGADALRFYLLSSPVMHADDLRFSEKDLDEVFKKVMMILMNVVSFYEMYSAEPAEKKLPKSKNILDNWINAKLNLLITEVTEAMEKYDLNEAVRPIGEFINDLSTWYLRRSRDRFKSEDADDKDAATKTLGFVLLTLSKVLAPFMPFIADTLYRKLGGKMESVHLEDWPEAKTFDAELLSETTKIRRIVSYALEERAKAGIPVRQPLKSLTVSGEKLKNTHLIDLIEITKNELNIKEVYFENGEVLSVTLDTEMNPELRLEGLKRELVRNINSLRKEAGLTIADRITLHFETENEEIKKVFATFANDLLRDTLSKEIIAIHIATPNERELTLGEAKVWIGF